MPPELVNLHLNTETKRINGDKCRHTKDLELLSAATWRRASVVVASFRLRLFATMEARASEANGGLIPVAALFPSLLRPLYSLLSSDTFTKAPHFTRLTLADIS
ncbi:unnamed protein product [Arctia plantaginis]|uniref:Uncharacterized protein n=1 Tax=Arctia plantaginis TaxID=874455 RepID=A0A8S0YZP7_ARCPL|nr:unnamed protein product [Arctia plantaginis]